MINPCVLPSRILRKLRKPKPVPAAVPQDTTGSRPSIQRKDKMTRNDIPPPSYTEAARDGAASATVQPNRELSLSIAAEASGDSLLVTVTPPSNVSTDSDKKSSNKRASLDLVTVIDVSGSMAASAPAYTEEGKPKEDTGLSVLDVVKHAMKTIIATMEDDDRLAIVAFDDAAEVISDFVSTDTAGKKKLNESVDEMYPKNMTNLWDGLKTGMNLLDGLQNGSSGYSDDAISAVNRSKGNRLSSVFILTDGQPNVEPPRGHIPMLETYLESHPNARFNISTFGFGYNLDSALLSDIARVGAGGFGFIPDAGMVGTVFVHAVSNLYATYATRCFVNVEIPEESGVKVKQPIKGGFPCVQTSWGGRIDFGDLQYGQTRDLVLEFDSDVIPNGTTISTVVKPWFAEEELSALATVSGGASSTSEMSQVQKYNIHRLTLVDNIFNLCREFTPTTSRHHYVRPENANSVLQDAKTAFTSQAGSITTDLPDYEPAQALAKDISGEVVLAVSDGNSWEKWGRHYFLSLARAHQRQQCGNFKDAGLQIYGKDSVLFTKSRDLVDAAFDKLPPPKPSYKRANAAPVNMSRYNMSAGPCFTGSNLVTLADGSNKRVDEIVRGTPVATPAGARTVEAVLKTHISEGLAIVCKVGELTVTPWHPILHDNKWCFPASVSEPEWAACDAVYSFLLEKDSSAESHAMEIGGVTAVTLGHGLMREVNMHKDVRVHPFFGSYERVMEELKTLRGFEGMKGVAECYGAVRDGNGLFSGFLKHEEDFGVMTAIKHEESIATSATA